MRRAVFGPVALIVLACHFASEGAAHTFAYPQLSIREQVDRADYALHARVLEIRHLGQTELDRPVGACGLLVKIAVLEQFKGAALPAATWFATHRILFPDRPLNKGDMVLVLLRDLDNERAARDLFKEELTSALARVRACEPDAPALYLAPYEESIFPIVAKSTDTLWLEYRGQTATPRSITPRLEGKCQPMREGGCVLTEHPSVAWGPLREELRSWSRR